MAITQSSLQQTILNAQYYVMTLLNSSYISLSAGGFPIKEKFTTWFQLSLQALTDQYNNNDYNFYNTKWEYNHNRK